MYNSENLKIPRGWQSMEFTYTVAKKIKAQIINPHPPMFFLEGITGLSAVITPTTFL